MDPKPGCSRVMPPDIGNKKNGAMQEAYRSCRAFPAGSLKNFSERMKTFKGWTLGFMDCKKLAEHGFYYTNTEDFVRCAFCNVRIGCWKEGDDPAVDHRRESPDCPLVKGEVSGSEQSGDETENSTEDDAPSQDVCGSYRLEIRPFSAPERPGKNRAPFYVDSVNLWKDFEELGVSKVGAPVAPFYATYNARLKSYQNWKESEVQSPEKLSEAGFYYTGYHDNVLCFHCGGGLKNWEVEDDPWVEHAKWFSKCGFVILRKGRAFVVEILAKEKRELTELGPKESSGSNATAGQKAKAESEKEKLANPPLPPPPPPSSSSPSGPARENQPSPSANSEGKEIELCRICYTRERGIVFLPCGHFVSCTECAPSLSSCAVCRKPFEATVRAYLS